MVPEDESCTSFSLVLKLRNKEERDKLRMQMIENQIYPAVLWNVPESISDEIVEFSQTMLSVHCDGRYTLSDIQFLTNKLERMLS